MKTQAVFVGIGSPHGDDRVGWRVAEELTRLVPAANVHTAHSPADLLDVLEDQHQLLICDGCRGSGVVGTVSRWQWPRLATEPIAFTGTHDLSLVATLELAQRLDRLPPDVRIWGVEIGAPVAGAPLTPGTALVASQLAREIQRELDYA